jgi:hypothetical protein
MALRALGQPELVEDACDVLLHGTYKLPLPDWARLGPATGGRYPLIRSHRRA